MILVDGTKQAYTPENAPTPGGGTPPEETAVIFNAPHAAITLDSGRALKIYSKSEGQLRRIDVALADWMRTDGTGLSQLARYERRGWWAPWRRWGWFVRWRTSRALQKSQTAKFRYYLELFNEPYMPEMAQDFGADEFLTMTLPLQAELLAAHKVANDVAVLGEIIFGKKKAPGVKRNPEILPSGTAP